MKEERTNGLQKYAPEEPPAPRRPFLARLGIGAKSWREEQEQRILAKYASITDPELRRMTADVMDFLEAKAANIRSASNDMYFGSPDEAIGKYQLGGEMPLRVELSGRASYRDQSWQDYHQEEHGWKNCCILIVDFRYQSQDNPHRFDGLMKDISRLSGLVPIECSEEDFDKYCDRKNPVGKFWMGQGFANGKLKFEPHGEELYKEVPQGLDRIDTHFEMDESKIDAFLSGVRKIKRALAEQGKYVAGETMRRL